MKKRLILSIAFAGIASLVFSSFSSGPAYNNLGNRTTTGCTGSTCHGGSSPTVQPVMLVIKDGTTPISSYTPGQQYTVELTGRNTTGGHLQFGFQAACVRTSNNLQAGIFSTTTGGIAVRNNIGGLLIVENEVSLTGTVGGTVNNYFASFKWIAPPAGTGQVQFNAALCSVNGNLNADTGDHFNITSTLLTEAVTGVNDVRHKLSLTTYPSPATTTLYLKVAGGFGKNPVVSIYDLTGRMLQQRSIQTGADEAVLNVQQLAAGYYVAVLRNEAGSGVMSFQKQ